MASFLQNHFAIYPLIFSNRRTYKKLIWIQKHIRNQLITRHSKVEVLINYWDKMINMLRIKANESRDQKILNILHNIIKVPKFIKRWILTLFVYRCRELYHIAFFQWRLKNPSTIRFDKDELTDLINFRIGYTFDPKIMKNKIPPLKTR